MWKHGPGEGPLISPSPPPARPLAATTGSAARLQPAWIFYSGFGGHAPSNTHDA
jgi:hypothetical protein